MTGKDFRGLALGGDVCSAAGFKSMMFVSRPGAATEQHCIPGHVISSCFLICKMSLGIIFAP